jgi:hypothetical protein
MRQEKKIFRTADNTNETGKEDIQNKTCNLKASSPH